MSMFPVSYYSNGSQFTYFLVECKISNKGKFLATVL